MLALAGHRAVREDHGDTAPAGVGRPRLGLGLGLGSVDLAGPMLTNGRYTYYDLLHVHLLMDEDLCLLRPVYLLFLHLHLLVYEDAEEIGQPVHEGRA
eukprot:scaffold79391_cov18-Phaeocystis_antarctica.AAC.1